MSLSPRAAILLVLVLVSSSCKEASATGGRYKMVLYNSAPQILNGTVENGFSYMTYRADLSRQLGGTVIGQLYGTTWFHNVLDTNKVSLYMH